MTRFIPILAVAGITFFGGSRAQAEVSTVELTGGDAGQGLTLDATKVVTAYNINGGGVILQGVTFNSFNLASNFGGSVSFGSGEISGNDVGMQALLNNLAWNGVNGELALTLSGLTANASYRLDLLQSTINYASREQAIVVNGQLVTLVNLTTGKAYNTSLNAEADESGSIALTLIRSGIYGGNGNQDGAVLNGLALTLISDSPDTPIPEPSAAAILMGLVALGCAGYRRRGVPNR